MRGDMLHLRRSFWAGAFGRAFTAVLLAAGLVCVAQNDAGPQSDKSAPAVQSQAPAPTDPAHQTAIAKPAGQQSSAATDTERKKQIADESTQLLSMALALKAEVDKTTKDTLSLNVIRKADEIEKLAHTVKEKMKSSGSS